MFFYISWDSSNGKSVVVSVMQATLLNLYHQTAKGIFMKGSKEKTDGPSPDKIELIGVAKVLLVCERIARKYCWYALEARECIAGLRAYPAHPVVHKKLQEVYQSL
jgi:hypothetical protein